MGLVTGDPDALEAYYKAHKDARKFRSQPVRWEMELRQLFEGVLATGEDVLSPADLIKESIESDSSAVETPSRTVNTTVRRTVEIPRKRVASSALPSSSKGKKITSSDRLGRELAGLAEQLESLVATMDKDYQRDAIKVFMKDYRALHPSFKLAIVEAFEKEYSVKTFYVLKPDMRRK
ncbi:hypothetical protein EK21DRAFT_117223 [Setomelanomma holmii]|uniref:Uncharacterized protein n=1 Tax=Setomelanomma holmii TaxID=210430 RepID=A0A9P4H0X4_9PLEO|nr:hypothetical protein EK21DRAFT_117223 [Setomelanomma holmii]